MKQVLQNFRSGDLKVDEVPETVVKDGGVLVQNHASLVSAGTEKMVIDLAQKSLLGKARQRPDLVRQVIAKVRRDGFLSTMRAVEARLDAPIALGYSCAGIVKEVGRGADTFRVGDRVACAGMNYASHAETVFVPVNLAVGIPDNIKFDEAAFVTLGAIALQGVRTAEVKLGDSVAVIGLGLVGQLTVQMLKAAGCVVVAIDLDASKVETARASGADVSLERNDDVIGAVTRATDGFGVDSVIITAAAESNDPVEIAGAIARDRAIVSMVGAVGMNIPRKVYFEKELQLRLSRSYGPGRYDAQYEEGGVDYPIGYVRWTERRNMQEFVRLLATGSVRVEPLITHRIPIDEAERAYEMISGKSHEPYLGIVLTYPQRESEAVRVVQLQRPRRAPSDGVRLGIVGAGNFAKAVLLPRLAKMTEARLTGLATATGRNAKAIGDQYGFSWCTTESHEVLQSSEIDAVIIATRHDTHAKLTAQALRAGKSVFVEKPLAIDQAGLDEAEAAVAEGTGQLMVGFNRRFSPLSAKAKSLFTGCSPLSMTYRINAGAIEKSSWIHGAEGGGRIVGEVCHFVDYLQFLTDALPVEVHAWASSAGADSLSILIKLGDGSVGSINYFSSGDRGLAKERVEIFGGGRVAIIDDFRVLETWHDGKRRVIRSSGQQKGFDEELQAFLSAVKTGAPMPIPWSSIRATTKATLKIIDSLSSGRPEAVH
jgi:predicted dehydrogenase/threonine dehydrogenase-like Zn-dependent dehydrogenase